jgi:REP-associated tyrosine transposase
MASFRGTSIVHGATGNSGMLGGLFDPKAEWLVEGHCRPHWSQDGTIVFITFRTRDSIPRDVIERWEREKTEWFQVRGYDVGKKWRESLPLLSDKERAEFQKHFDCCREDFLDTCHGRCLLRRPELARIVADALMHFDGQRYVMGDFVIMPNHVHLLAVFFSADSMKVQCDSWLHYSASRINPAIGERGKLWQQEPFDHLVRSPEQYEYLRTYIADNPRKAHLRPGEFYYRRYSGR